MNEIKKSNEGFSLIEMLVSVLITAIMMLAVGVFISTSNVTFQRVTISSKLQDESSAANNFLSEILLEAVDMCVSPDDSAFKYWIVKSLDNEDGAGKTSGTDIDYDFYIFMLTNPNAETTSTLRYAKVDEADEINFKKSIADNNNIVNETQLGETMYKKYIKNDTPGADNKYSSKYNVIAQCLTSLSITRANGRLFNINAKYNYLSTEYESNFSVNSRNQIAEKWNN